MIVTRFSGLVHPTGCAWHFDDTVTVQRDDEDIWIGVWDSTFTVRVSSPEGAAVDFEWIEQLWQRTSAVVRAALDSLGFLLGASLEIELLSGTVDHPPNFTNYYPGGFRSLSGTIRGAVDSQQITPYVTHAMGSADFRHALADVRAAQKLDDDTAFYAYRVIESLRQTYVETGDSGTKESWERLRNKLGLTRADLQDLQEAATARRHGENMAVEQAKKLEFVNLARDLVTRFVTQPS
jgi:hypothetical protein